MNYKKIPYFELIPIILISVIIFKVVNSIEDVTSLVGTLLSFLSYFLWGWLIAFFINPAMVYLEKKFKTKRILSIIIVYTLFIGIIALVITLITPAITRNILELAGKLPRFIGNIEDSTWDLINKYDVFDRFGLDKYVKENLSDILSKLNHILTSGLNLIFSQLINLTSSLFKFITGIVISIYMLIDKERIIRSSKRITFSLFNEDHAQDIIDIGRETHRIFSQYIIGKFLDSIILASILCVILGIFKIPYFILISLLMGITNMIPYFGNLIGAVPSCLITLFISPVKALVLIILIIIVCEFETLYVGPKVLGGRVGLSPLLIIMAMAIGGGLYGIWGMFFSVPIMAVIKAMIEEVTNRRLKEKKIDIDI